MKESNPSIFDRNLTKVASVSHNTKTAPSFNIDHDQRKLLVFKSSNNNIEIFRNDDYLSNLQTSIRNTMSFLIPFQRFKVFFNLVFELKRDIKNNLDNTQKSLAFWIKNISDLENEQVIKIEEHQYDIDKFIKEKEENIKRKEFREHTKETAINLAQDNREQIVKEEKDFQKRVEGNIVKAQISKQKSEQNLQKIQNQKIKIKAFESDFGNLISKYQSLEETCLQYMDFIKSVDGISNILTSSDINSTKLFTLIQSLITYYKELGQIDIESINFYQELKKNGELIEINKHIADIEIKLAIKIIEIPFLNAEKKLAEERNKKNWDEFRSLKIYDTVGHIQDNVRDLNSNSLQVERGINSIKPYYSTQTFVKSVDVSKGYTIVDVDHHKYNIDYVSSVNTSREQIKYVSSIELPRLDVKRVDPFNVLFSKETQEAHDIYIESRKKLEEIEQEVKQKDILEAELNHLNRQPNLLEKRNIEEIQNRKTYHDVQLKKYQNLLSEFDILSNGIKREYTDALVAVILSESTVEQEAKCCICIKMPDQPSYLNTSITLNQFYDMFAKIIRTEHGISNQWCVSSKQRVHTLNRIELDYVIKLITELRFVGSLKNSNKERQKVINDHLREEDIELSLINVISKTIGVSLLQQKIELDIDSNSSLEELDRLSLIGQTPWVEGDYDYGVH
jgi:hypothetical protein